MKMHQSVILLKKRSRVTKVLLINPTATGRIQFKTSMFIKRFLLLPVLLVAILPACSRHEPAQKATAVKASTPPAVSDEGLMQSIFGKHYRRASKEALVVLKSPQLEANRHYFLISPRAHTVLPSGLVVFVANAQDADAKGNSMSMHPSPGSLLVYMLHHEKKGWVVKQRFEEFDSFGSFGDIGKAEWVKLGPNKTGLAILGGDTAQGATITFLSLYDVTDGHLRRLNQTPIEFQSDNQGACGPDSHCWEIGARMSFVTSRTPRIYDDLLLTFSGNRSEPVGDVSDETDLETIERKETPVHGSARYHFNGKVYELIDGENIVPGV